MFNWQEYYKTAEEYMNSVNTFIIHAFGFYNGKINVINKAFLNVNWAMRPSSATVGCCTNPNKVTIFPRVVEQFAETAFDYFYYLLEAVIHELYHADQIINFPRLLTDEAYVQRIESPVEMQTAIYIVNHQAEIAEEFGLIISSGFAQYVLDEAKKLPYFPYFRRRYIDHIMVVFLEMLTCVLTQADIESTYAGFSSAFKNPNCQVVFKINGVVLVVKDKDYFIDIATFNARVYALFFKDQYRASEAEIDYQNADNLIIKFTQDSVNLMCKIKEEK